MKKKYFFFKEINKLLHSLNDANYFLNNYLILSTPKEFFKLNPGNNFAGTSKIRAL